MTGLLCVSSNASEIFLQPFLLFIGQIILIFIYIYDICNFLLKKNFSDAETFCLSRAVLVKYVYNLSRDFSNACKYCIVLYYIDGVVIAAQCTATFSRSIVLPRI